MNFFHGLTLLVHKNRCCAERCNCVHQEKAVMSAGDRTVGECCDCGCFFSVKFWLVWDLLSADVSNPIYWVTEASRRLSVCEEKEDRLVFLHGLQSGVK